MSQYYEELGPIIYVPEYDDPYYFHVVKNPDFMCIPQIVTFAEMHEYLFRDEYNYLFYKMLIEHRLPLGKLRRFDYEQISVKDFTFRKIKLQRVSDTEFEFYPVAEVFFSVFTETGQVSLSEWYSIPGRYKLEDGFWLFQDIEVYDYRKFPADNMTEYLIPILNNYESAAEEMLKKYLPSALKNPCPVDADALADAMGFVIKQRRLSDNYSAEGKVIFGKTKVKVYDKNGNCRDEEFEDRTILIDTDACEKNSVSRRCAIIHECVHVYQHRLFFDLQQQYRQLLNQCENLSLEDLIFENMAADCVQMMEKQADRLTPRVLMPAKTAGIIIEESMDSDYLRGSFVQIERAIKHLASFADASLEMSKNRMIELGYKEAKGVLNYANNRYIPSYLSDNEERYNKSYTIPIDKLTAEIQRNKDLERLIQTGRFIYAEGHLCLRDDKYLWYKDKKPCLSPYARNHINECCLLFTIRHNQTDYQYIPDVLNKESSHNNSEYMHSAAFYSNLRASTDEDRNEERMIPDGFYEAFHYFKEKSGRSYLNISMETHIEKSRLERITSKNPEKRLTPTYNEVVALAVTLCQSADLALAFIEASEEGVDKTAKQRYVRNLIFMLIGSGIDEFNFAMVSGGYEPLTQETPEISMRSRKNVCSN